MEFKFKKIYLETTNICNLNCDFCHKTKRDKKMMNLNEFKNIVDKIENKSEYLYFHLMGEPLLNKDIYEFLKYSAKKGFKNIITTNGTLLNTVDKRIFNKDILYKMNISIHSYDGNDNSITLKEYLYNTFSIIDEAIKNNVIICYRLWNVESVREISFNNDVLKIFKEYFDNDLIENRKGYKIGSTIYTNSLIFLEYDLRFKWPDENGDRKYDKGFCYALRDQIGILVDGSVVPCCLDADGVMTLGNINNNTLDEILSDEKIKKFYDLFSNKILPRELCKTCGFIRRFNLGEK